MAASEVAVNDRWPSFEAAEAISAGNTLTFDSNGKVVKGADDSSVIAGYALTDAASGEEVTVVPARYGYVANVLVSASDGTGGAAVAVNDELLYASDGTLMEAADGTGGTGRTVSAETAAIALEAVTSETAVLAKVFIMGGVS